MRPVDLTRASGHPELCLVKGYNGSIFVGAINRRGLGLGLEAKHTRALVAYVVVLGSPPSHICLIVIIQLCERAILLRLHHEVASSGTR